MWITPETVKPQSPVECYGPEASSFTKAQLKPGTEVRLETEAEPTDRYGRTLAHVVRVSDGFDLGQQLLQGGFARTMSIKPNISRQADYEALEAQARTANVGLWASCGS